VFEFPDEAILTSSTLELCDTISTIISANQPQSGTGEWVVLSGAGTLNNQFANITGVNNLSIGVNEIIWTVSSAECGTNSDTLTITVYELPLPASTVDTVYACDLEFVQLTANQPSNGTGLWYDVEGNALFSDANSVPTNVSNLTEGWNQIIWSISNGSCPVSTDTANVYKTETAEIIFPDGDTTVLCLEENNIGLVGTEPAQSTAVQWYFIEGSGLLSNPFNHECNVTAVEFGKNVLVYEMKKQQCPATRDTAIIIVNTCNEYGDFPNMITPNEDGQNDVWVLDNLNSIYPDCVVRIFNRWGNIVFESEGYLDNWDGTHKGERLPMGTYYYTIDLNDAEGSVLKGYVSIVY
jgi:gliding motility-associated-like protein